MKLPYLPLTVLMVSYATAQPTITSDAAPPVVKQGTAHQFAATCTGGCTYTLAPGSVGTIDNTGLYRAPAHVTVNQSVFGCQVLPPDHAFNTPISGLPVRTESAAWVSLLANGRMPLTFDPGDTPINPISSSTPSHPLTFIYTPQNNGSYQLPAPPDLLLQGGYYHSGGDRHYLAVRPDTCAITEIYNFTGNAPSGYDVFPITSSGLTYNSMNGTLPNGSTNAAGGYFIPNTLRVQEVMKALATGASVIPHPINITLANYSQLGSSIPEWPATTVAVSAVNTIPYGARFRLKASYTYTGTSPITAILINTMKQYGFFVSDGGYSMNTYGMDSDIMPPGMAQAVQELTSLFPASAFTNFEFVRQAALAPANPLAPDGGLIDPNAARGISGYLPPQYAQVLVSDSSGTAKMRVLLQGATIDFGASMYSFQAGALAFQLPYYIRGLPSSDVTCTMSPAVGTLDASTCTYTPPAAIAVPTMTTVTVTANADSTVKTQTNVLVLPDGGLGLLPAAPSN